jgi:hypothetical protein
MLKICVLIQHYSQALFSLTLFFAGGSDRLALGNSNSNEKSVFRGHYNINLPTGFILETVTTGRKLRAYETLGSNPRGEVLPNP